MRRAQMRTRTVVRYCVALVGGLIACNQVLAASQAWHDWHAWVVTDPSLADFYRTDFWVDVVSAAPSVAVAGFLCWLLGPHHRAGGLGSAAPRGSSPTA
jgi:hypothetical protein